MNTIYSGAYLDELLKMLEDDVFNELKPDCNILITGATGMIGSYLVDLLMMCNQVKNTNINVYAMGRSKERLLKRFTKFSESSNFKTVTQNVEQPLDLNVDFEFIIHAASNANPQLYATQPVETLTGNFLGMKSLLDYARNHAVTKTLFISSGEMYGIVYDSSGFDEKDCGFVDYENSRACYPSGKRSAEVLCQCYKDEYNVNVSIVRPCHIYGPTMASTDVRAISQFIQKAVEKEDIVLKSKGEQIRSHCYVADAVMGIMYVLLYGGNGEAYNIAGDDSIMSIYELANEICQIAGTKIKFDIPSDMETKGFSKVPIAVLKNEKLKSLGWESKYGLKNGLKATINILEEGKH